jgi:three-Cys-motif partner protein
MADLIVADDGLLAEDGVGDWVDEKHRILREYLKYQANPRQGFLGPTNAGATYIDPFCGPGRARVRDTDRFVEGSAVVAWKASVAQEAPFSALYIADKDSERRACCGERLRRLGAPVVEIEGEALAAVQDIVRRIDPYGLHFAFLDPYSLGALRIQNLQALASVKRMDVLVHLSAMDLFRNLDMNITQERDEFDLFAPGWRSVVDNNLPKDEQRRAIIDYWKNLVDGMGFKATAEMKAIRNSRNRVLYWLLLISRHQLAQKFWKIVLESGQQRGLGL